MKYILLTTLLFSLTSCFKTDIDGNVFLFENDNSAQLTFKLDGLNSSAYFGINNEYGPSDTDVTGFSTDTYWCLRRFNINIKSGSDSDPRWDIYINGGLSGVGSFTQGQEINLSIHPGDSLKVFYQCISCTSLTGTFSLEMDKCDN